MTIRVLIVDDQRLARLGLALMTAKDPGLKTIRRGHRRAAGPRSGDGAPPRL